MDFQIKISDFGLSTVLDGTQSQQSIVGTPLYQSPQVLKRRCYNDAVDTWALGVVLYELLMGVTPFHCFDMKELVRKINDGRYKLSVESGTVKIETCLFLLDCLQTLEDGRISARDLTDHPYISDAMMQFDLNDIDKEAFLEEVGGRDKFSDFTSSDGGSAMLSRFDDTEIMEEDIVLTTRRSYHREILVRQLSK